MSEVRLTWNPRPRYNIAPTQQVAVVLDEEPGVFFPEIRWGLIPSWAKDAKIGASLIHARSETVAAKPNRASLSPATASAKGSMRCCGESGRGGALARIGPAHSHDLHI